jgi:hypothetical protein
MTATTIRVQMAQRKDTAANWTAANPILLSGEIGYETDTKKFKIGNGSTNWNSLAYLPIPDGSGNLTITGNLEIGSTGSLTFEGSTADGFETTLAVTNPTADRTITLPNQSGTVLVSGNASIVDADIAANAEIAVSKLADGTARQLLQTDAAGTGVEWTSNVDIPGTLDVTGAATFDAAVTVAGDLTVNGTTTTISTQNLLVEDKNIIIGDVATPTDVTADGGGITLKGTTDKTINWVDATDAWTSSERFSVPLGTAALPSLMFTGDTNTGIYSPGADQVAISTGGSGRLFVDASGNVGVGTGGTQGTKLHAVGGNIWSGNFYEVGRFQKSSGTAISLGYDNSDYVATVGAYSHDGTPSNLSFWTYPGSGAVQERLRIDSSGRVGIGTSSPGAPLDVVGSVNTVVLSDSATNAALKQAKIQCRHYTSSEENLMMIYAISDSSANEINIGGGSSAQNYATQIGFWTAANNTSTTGTERLRITSAGNVGIGTTSDRNSTKLDVLGDITFGANASYYGTLGYNAGTGHLEFTSGDGGFKWIRRSGLATSMVLDSSGRLLVGTSTGSSPASGKISLKAAMNTDNGVVIQNSDTQGAGQYFALFYNSADVAAGSISHSGTTSVSFNTSSDYRLKENVTAVTDGITRLQQLKPSRFNFIADPAKTVDGFIAHEVQTVVPEAITGEKDAVDDDGNPIYQGIDQSKLVPLLTAALQEAVAKIESLEARLTAAGI